MFLFLYLVHDGLIFKASSTQIKFTVIHGRVDFGGVLGHVKLTLLRRSHVLRISLELLDRDVSLLNRIVDLLIHVRQITLEFLRATVVLYA